MVFACLRERIFIIQNHRTFQPLQRKGRTMQQQLEQLKRRSLQLVEDMPVVWPGNRTPAPFKVSNILKTIGSNKAYAYNHKAIAYTYHGELFVTPYSKESLNIIRNAGFKLREFFVPFSNRGDKPSGEYAEKWQKLLATA